MKLNIYEKKKIVKTYEADEYALTFGVVEDVANAVKVDEIKAGTDTEILTLAINLVMKSTGTVRDLMKDIFDGITDEELRKTTVVELAQVLVDIVKYTFAEIGRSLPRKN